MATKLSLVVFPKAGAFHAPDYYDKFKENARNDPKDFEFDIGNFAAYYMLKVTGFTAISAGHFVIYGAYVELDLEVQSEVLPELEKNFSVRPKI